MIGREVVSKLPIRKEVNTSTNLHNQNRMQGGARWYGRMEVGVGSTDLEGKPHRSFMN